MGMLKLTGFLVVVCTLLAGCAQPAPPSREVQRDYSPQGVVKRQEVIQNNQVVSQLHRVLNGVLVEGKGAFTNGNQAIARNMALNLAINDLAKAAGEVLVEEDTNLYNDQVRMIIRTRARNIVSGYQVVTDTYDIGTKTAMVTIRQEGERIASEIQKEIGK